MSPVHCRRCKRVNYRLQYDTCSSCAVAIAATTVLDSGPATQESALRGLEDALANEAIASAALAVLP